MSGQPKIVTGLGKAELHRILVRGYDLTEDLAGKITFSQMVFLMLTGRMPTHGQTRMVDALLVILVEHGMVASVVAARLTYHTAPEAIQGAVAAAILGAGSVHLGSSEWSARMLQEALSQPTNAADLNAIAAAVGPYCDLLQRIARAAEAERGRRLPVNVTGAIAAIASDLGLPWPMSKAFAIIGRALGAMAHIGEEISNPMAGNIDAAIKSALAYETDGKEKR